MIAIVKTESDDTALTYTLFIWNGLKYVKKDSTFVYWCDVYGNNNERIAINQMINKHDIGDNWQLI